jgi:carboxypeptidase D
MLTAVMRQIAVWLTGGPGCSSLAGLILENGPFLWQSGTYSPIRNPYSWVNLTNMVWIDQPAGTGMSPGPWTANNEIDVANQFNDFWVRFMDTFDLHGRKIYIIGESYAGEYIPYIASSMLDKNDKTYYDVSGVMLVDGLINEWDTMIEGKYHETLSLGISGVGKITDCEVSPLWDGLELLQ